MLLWSIRSAKQFLIVTCFILHLHCPCGQFINLKACKRADSLVSKAVDVGTAGNIPQAWEFLREAVDICPSNAAALGNLGYLHAIHGDAEKAREFLQRSIYFGPSSMEPWVNLGNIFKEQLDHIHDSDEAEYKALKKVVWELYKTAYRLQPSVDVTANLAGLYAMERNWEYAALVAEKSLAIQYTEEAFCVLMKALDNICNWEHPMRDMPRLIAILERNVRDAARARALSIAYHTSTVCPRGAQQRAPPGRFGPRRRPSPSCATTPARQRSSRTCRRPSCATWPAPRWLFSNATPPNSPHPRPGARAAAGGSRWATSQVCRPAVPPPPPIVRRAAVCAVAGSAAAVDRRRRPLRAPAPDSSRAGRGACGAGAKVAAACCLPLPLPLGIPPTPPPPRPRPLFSALYVGSGWGVGGGGIQGTLWTIL